MKKKSVLLNVTAAFASIVVMILVMLTFRKFNLFDAGNQSLSRIITTSIGGYIIFFFIIQLPFFRKRMKASHTAADDTDR